jgi:PhzF family phenazine biosynthesis protein
MHLPLYQVDAFTSRLFAGNPAAVCPLDQWLPDATMQAIAAENNLSETAFFIPNGDDYDLRWFTPAIEVDLCGHATLASGFIVLTRLAPQLSSVSFNTKSGRLTVCRSGQQFALELPSRPPTPAVMPDKFLTALGGQPKQILAASKYLAVYETAEEVAALSPDFGVLKHIDKQGMIATAPGPASTNDACDFVSRYFAPHAGVNEDPVTGSAHCTLVPYWAQRLGKSKLYARQISARGGELHCDLLVTDGGDRVRMAGGAVLYLEGRIYI